ncbi:MAG: STAS domain-containing protein [Negativicutes bacterium]|nr:STAS domain-containing protein [Negativicutes bacterium]
MGCTVSEKDGVVVITPSDRVYSEEAAFIRQTAMELVEQGKVRFLFDFSRVKYIDSSGLGVLIALNKRASALGGTVVIQGLKGMVGELFDLTSLNKIFTIE